MEVGIGAVATESFPKNAKERSYLNVVVIIGSKNRITVLTWPLVAGQLTDFSLSGPTKSKNPQSQNNVLTKVPGPRIFFKIKIIYLYKCI